MCKLSRPNRCKSTKESQWNCLETDESWALIIHSQWNHLCRCTNKVNIWSSNGVHFLLSQCFMSAPLIFQQQFRGQQTEQQNMPFVHAHWNDTHMYFCSAATMSRTTLSFINKAFSRYYAAMVGVWLSLDTHTRHGWFRVRSWFGLKRLVDLCYHGYNNNHLVTVRQQPRSFIEKMEKKGYKLQSPTICLFALSDYIQSQCKDANRFKFAFSPARRNISRQWCGTNYAKFALSTLVVKV